MTEKFYPIDTAIFFRASGAHATRYLHNRLSNNIRDLKVGSHCRAAALSPQGRPEAFVTILREEQERYLVWSDGGDRNALRAGLLRYKVADRVELADVDLKLWHVAGGADRNITAKLSGVATIASGRTLSGLDLVGTTPPPPDWQEISRSEATALRIAQKWPVFPEEINDSCMLLELGLSDAVSFTKGCYVGQEVLERVDAQGRPPRRLYVGKLSTPPTDNSVVDNGGRTIGELLTHAQLGSEGWIAFALLKSSIAAAPGDSFQVGNGELIIDH